MSAALKLTRKQKIEYHNLLQERNDRHRYNQLQRYAPYPKQLQFHNYGSTYSSRCLGAGNQLGKTYSAANEVAIHATGDYPEWWQGKRFDTPVVIWVGGVSGATIRDTSQKLLVGRVELEEYGTGSIPKDKIVHCQKALGTPNLLDHVRVKHNSGKDSLIFFKSYEQGRLKWQGETIHLVWFDEEPPEDIYTEGLTRTNKHGQFVMLTFTPLLGMTAVAMKFYKHPKAHEKLINMTIDDVDHYTPAEKQKIIDSYPDYEVDARIKGIPTLGEGRVYQIAEEAILEDTLEYIPDHWARLNGIDFGSQNQAAIQMVWDKDADIIHITHEHYDPALKTPLLFSPAVKKWGNVLTAWPHDGYTHDRSSGKEVKELYVDYGLRMLDEHATHESGGNGVEAGIAEILDRMQTGRFKVARHLTKWIEEFRLYHRKDGKIVKAHDHLLDAARYAVMMKRCAKNIIEEKTKDLEFESEW